jgi:hypothetical protein
MEVSWADGIISLIAIFGASSGFWAWLTNRQNAESAQTKLLMGLALDRIIMTGNEFVDRGWVTVDEYGEFKKYLYEPYKKLGGNGTADKIMSEVDKLPTQSRNRGVAVSFQLQRGNDPNAGTRSTITST